MASTAKQHDCRSSRRRLMSGRRNRRSRSRARAAAFTKIVADSSVTTRPPIAWLRRFFDLAPSVPRTSRDHLFGDRAGARFYVLEPQQARSRSPSWPNRETVAPARSPTGGRDRHGRYRDRAAPHRGCPEPLFRPPQGRCRYLQPRYETAVKGGIGALERIRAGAGRGPRKQGCDATRA